MDLRLIGRALWRFKAVVIIGVVLAVLLAGLSYFKVQFHGATPSFSPRAQEVWQADSTILITQRGFPAGRVNGGDALGRFIGLAPLYAKLANSDAVKSTIKGLKTKLHGSYDAIPAADTSYGSVSGLPAITIIGRANKPANALTITGLASNAFLRYLHDEQNAADISAGSRVDTQLLNSPGDLTLIVPRKKTLPIVVLLGVLLATVACVLVLENARPRTGTRAAVEPVSESSVQDLGRSA